MNLLRATINRLLHGRKTKIKSVPVEQNVVTSQHLADVLRDSYISFNHIEDTQLFFDDDRWVLTEPIKKQVYSFGTEKDGYHPKPMIQVFEYILAEIYQASDRASRIEYLRLEFQENHDVRRNRDEALRMMHAAAEFETVNMDSWQCHHGKISPLSATVEVGDASTLHKCGNTACFGGHIRINEMYNRYYRFRETTYAPILFSQVAGALLAEESVGYLLGIPTWLANLMIYDAGIDKHPLYKKEWDAIRGEDIVTVLKMLDTMTPEEILENVVNKD